MNQSTTSLDLPQKTLAQLTKNGFYHLKDIPSEEIKNFAQLTTCPTRKSAWECYQKEITNGQFLNLNFFADSIKQLIESEIQAGLITELTGLPGSGKTQMCLRLALSSSESLYVSTNRNFSSRRIREICKSCNENEEERVKNVHLLEIDQDWQFNAFLHYLNSWLPQNNIRLLVIDSIYWVIRQIEAKDRQGFYQNFFDQLRKLADLHKFAIVVTNCFTLRRNKDELGNTSAFRDTFYHAINNRLILSKENRLFGVEVAKSVTGNVQQKIYYE